MKTHSQLWPLGLEIKWLLPLGNTTLGLSNLLLHGFETRVGLPTPQGTPKEQDLPPPLTCEDGNATKPYRMTWG